MIHRFLLIWFMLPASLLYAQRRDDPAERIISQGNGYLARFQAASALERYNEVIRIAEERGDDLLLARGYLGAGQAIWYQNRFTRAIDTVSMAVSLFRKYQDDRDNKMMLSSSLRILSNIYDQVGNYEKAFQTISEALYLQQKSDDRQNTILSLVQLAKLYVNIGDYATALHYFNQAIDMHPRPGNYEFRELHTELGRLYAAREMYDSALYHYRLSVPRHPSPKNVYLWIGESYLQQRRYDSAESYLRKALIEGDIPNSAVMLQAMIDLGETLMYTSRNDSALVLANDALAMATEKDRRQHRRDAFRLLAMLYEKRGNNDLAYASFRRYVSLKDSLLSEQFKGRLYAFKQGQEETTHKAEMALLKNKQRVLVGSIIVLTAAGLFIILLLVLRYKNRSLELQRRSSEMEMQALRAQMNPHFIFNCMSAINHFILNNETDKASDYLTRFSRLIRLVLANSEKASITMEEEIAMLKLYLEMEQLRFAHAFEYRISYDSTIRPSEIMVPSFILQPFCENAIWHGLLHKEGPGLLLVDFVAKHNIITCTITDNGVGLTRAAEIKKRKVEEHIPFGHKLAAERLSLFNNGRPVPGSFIIEDVVNDKGEVTGTRVVFSFKNIS